jgi:hypothetical protein
MWMQQSRSRSRSIFHTSWKAMAETDMSAAPGHMKEIIQGLRAVLGATGLLVCGHGKDLGFLRFGCGPLPGHAGNGSDRSHIGRLGFRHCSTFRAADSAAALGSGVSTQVVGVERTPRVFTTRRLEMGCFELAIGLRFDGPHQFRQGQALSRVQPFPGNLPK